VLAKLTQGDILNAFGDPRPDTFLNLINEIINSYDIAYSRYVLEINILARTLMLESYLDILI